MSEPEQHLTLAAHIRKRRSPRFSRADRSPLGLWFWEIDRVLLSFVAALICIGLVAVAVASPVAAQKLSTAHETLSPYYFFYRQLMWVILGVPLMLGISMLSRTQARRLAIGGTVLFMVLMFAVYFVGTEVNGARRWIGSGVMRLQPSEFLKPMFVVMLAWILSFKAEDEKLPVERFVLGLTGVVAGLLMLQPDLGQTIIFVGSALVLLLLAGMPLRWMGMLAGAGGVGLIAAYLFYENARNRINIWLMGIGDDFQVARAHDTIVGGGLVGMGPNAGVHKFKLPEAHTDYIFSVIGEEFGLLACMAIVIVFLAIVVRVLTRLLDEEDQFSLLAAAGLVAQFGGQAVINMAVNTQLAPSKGMTLPFISYGGSSLLALCLGMGLLLALTRRNPYQATSPYSMRWSV